MPQDVQCHKIDKEHNVTCTKVLIALGANLPSGVGKPVQTLNAAISRLGDSRLHIRQISRFFSTPCFPAGAGPDYVNAAAELTGADDPQQVLEVLHRIEAEFGRARDRRWAGRTLDLDLIAMGDMVCPDRAGFVYWRGLTLAEQMTQVPDRIILPHPRLQDRAFVLVPLCDIAPDWRHPVLGLSVREMTEDLPDSEKIAVKPL